MGTMSFSVVYQLLIEKRKAVHRRVFFQRLKQYGDSLSMKACHLWMREYVQALYRHCQERDIQYYVSTRNSRLFVKTLASVLKNGSVDDLCLDICFRHVCRLCPCRDREEICLQPHSSKRVGVCSE